MSDENKETSKEEVKETKESKETNKSVVMIPLQTFGFERKAYVAGERYVMAQKDLPTAVKGMYKTESVKESKKAVEAEEKASKKKVPVLGK